MSRLAVRLSLLVALVSCSAPTPEDLDGGDTADTSATDARTACRTAEDCDDGVFCNGTEACGASGTCLDGTPPNCDDGVACTVDSCVESRRACESSPPDADHDGIASAACVGGDGVPLGTDCNDGDATTYPGNVEVCDALGHDEDCNGSTFGDTDLDGDGAIAATCCNVGGLCGTDCDDGDLNVGPDAPEVCNGANDDCDLLIDEGLPSMSYWPDCDDDGYGDASVTPMMLCTAPPATPSCASGSSAWVMQAGDCDDADPGRNAGNPEVCNGIDDDCDTRIDDIIDGTVVCGAGQRRSCRSTCGVDGVQACADSCLGWDAACLATEVCNGCDDDLDGLVDDGFECGRGTSSACTVAACGTSGTRVCSDSCGWGACVASESCNYCDDDGDGNFNEERPLASLSVTDQFRDCSGGRQVLYGAGTDCYTSFDGPGSDFDLWADILDGTSANQAGALWLEPSGWFQGWGAIEVTVELEVRAISAGGGAEMPLGGWNVVVARSGTTGVGTPQARGLPTTVTGGIAASWFWSTFELTPCTPGFGYPPSPDDSVRFMRLLPSGAIPLRSTASSPDSGCFSGEGLEGSALDFDGVGTVIRERMVLRYTPDDPTTATVDEERATLAAGTPGQGGTITYTYDPASDLPIGSGPLRIGITAGTYTQGGFSGDPSTFGVPVRARAHIFRQHIPSGGGSPTFTYSQTISRSSICP